MTINLSMVQFHIDALNIGHLTLNVPGVETNNISQHLLEDLNFQLKSVATQEIKALIIRSGKSNLFSAGADLTQFEFFFLYPHQLKSLLQLGHQVFNQLQLLPFPTIALINGMCIGGGLELALGCTYRVAIDHINTVMGFPEVLLDIIPGWGGTQRLPRLVGLKESLNLILTGKYIRAQKAFDIKLIDAIISDRQQEKEIIDFAQFCLTEEGKREILERRKHTGFLYLLGEKNFLGRFFLFRSALRDVEKKIKGHYQAPSVALHLIKETYLLPLQEGLKKETQTFLDNLNTKFSHARNIIALFLAREDLKKEMGVASTISPLSIHNVAVIGAGVMGNNIAWLFSYYNYSVKLKDINQDVIRKGFKAIETLYQKFVKLQKLKPEEMQERINRISLTTNFCHFYDVNFIIEAATENLELKKNLLSELENHIQPHAIVGSNTSSLKISDLACAMQHPERFIGIHFFNPPSRMPLVEIVPSPYTSQETIVTAIEMCNKLGKIPLVVQDCTGFLVNRIIVLGANEIMMILQETQNIARLEKIMINFGMVMGFLALCDEVGNDVTLKVMQSLESAYGERMRISSLIQLMNEHQLLGKKTGKGFYSYDTNAS